MVIDGKKRRLLDEVDGISSVSGGSFTAGYYGLFGDRIFEDFETKFLKKNIQGALDQKDVLKPDQLVQTLLAIPLIGAISQRNIMTSMSLKAKPLVTSLPEKDR